VAGLRLAALLAAAVATAASDPAPVAPGSAVPPAPATRTLTVVVTGIVETKGQLLVHAFTSAQGWPKPQHAVASARVPAVAPETVVRLEGLPVGPCAVSVVQDLDLDGKLTMRWFPFPRPAEPTGASNDARGTLGPPSFEAARFELEPEGGSIRITLRP
jgi:uncharacterized protein (DUF2141 family)